MKRRPPRSTRTDTFFPCTTLFRSLGLDPFHDGIELRHVGLVAGDREAESRRLRCRALERLHRVLQRAVTQGGAILDEQRPARSVAQALDGRRHEGEGERSEVRRVGKECVSTCRLRWSPYTLEINKIKTN